MSGVEVEIEAGWSDWLSDVESVVIAAAEAALRGGPATNRNGVVVLLTDDQAVAELNRDFRGREGPTNVLSFPAPAGPGAHLGDLALALGVCQREAVAQGKTARDHVAHLVVHGTLHLLGMDHQDDAEAETMERLERTILAGMDVPNPYASQDGTFD